MDILQKINKLRKDRGWTIYKLADISGINQSTLSNMFTRNTLPSISTLKMLCEAFNITLSEFFASEENPTPIDELILVSKYRKLNNANKKVVNDLLTSMIETQK